VVKLQIKKSQTTYNLKQTEYILLDFVSIGNKDTKLLVGDVRSHKLLVHIEEIN
jgi:expansin (peptidoglycan-binding protein)